MSVEFEVIMKLDDEAEESKFRGSLDECKIFADGFVKGILEFTSFKIYPSEDDATILHSPLISLPEITIWISPPKSA